MADENYPWSRESLEKRAIELGRELARRQSSPGRHQYRRQSSQYLRRVRTILPNGQEVVIEEQVDAELYEEYHEE